MKKLSRKVAGVLVVLVVPCFIAGCGGSAPPTGQVVAKVDDSEITVSQLNAVLIRLPSLEPAQLEEKKAEAINALIQIRVAANQAIKLKLDRTPDATVLLDAMRNQMLSQLYLAEYMQHIAKPSQAESQKYYRDHASAYADRKVYGLLELSVDQPSDALRARLKAQLAEGDTLEGLASKLRADGVANSLSLVSIRSDKLAEGTAAALSAAAQGSIVADPSGENRYRIYQIKSVAGDPVAFSAAEADIQQALYADAVNAQVKNQVSRLVDTAQVEYSAEYVKYAPSAKPDGAAIGTGMKQ